MGTLNDILEKVKLRKKEPSILEKLEVTPDMLDQLQQLGFSQTDVEKNESFTRITIDILKKYPDGFETLNLIPKKNLKNNAGLPYASIEKYGTQKVKEVLGKYGRDNLVYLNDVLSAIAKTDEGIVDEISSKFGLNNLSIIAPHYAEYGEKLTKKILDKWGNENSLLWDVFPIYRELQKANKESRDKETKQYEITFEGHVQGVGFRSDTRDYAKICSLTGTVKNLDNGNVFCELQGPDQLVDFFTLRLENRFKITNIVKKETELKNPFSDFKVIW